MAGYNPNMMVFLNTMKLVGGDSGQQPVGSLQWEKASLPTGNYRLATT